MRLSTPLSLLEHLTLVLVASATFTLLELPIHLPVASATSTSLDPAPGAQAALLEAVEDCGFEASLLGPAGAAALSMQASTQLTVTQAGQLRSALGGHLGVTQASVDEQTGRLRVRPCLGPRRLLRGRLLQLRAVRGCRVGLLGRGQCGASLSMRQAQLPGVSSPHRGGRVEGCRHKRAALLVLIH